MYRNVNINVIINGTNNNNIIIAPCKINAYICSFNIYNSVFIINTFLYASLNNTVDNNNCLQNVPKLPTLTKHKGQGPHPGVQQYRIDYSILQPVTPEVRGSKSHGDVPVRYLECFVFWKPDVYIVCSRVE